jgi:hypothetical protein
MMQRRKVPRLMGNMEARAVLGMSRAGVHAMISTGRLRPISSLACGHIFLAEEVETLRRERDLQQNKNHH